MKIVADTNVIVSALLWKKKLERFARLINEQKIILCFSSQTIDELIRVAEYPHILNKARNAGIDIFAVIDKLIANSIIVHPRFIPSLIVEDPSDNMFLACAIEAEADFLVSGDKHLLKLKSFQNIPILAPKQFLNCV